jgi:hypothetical protein
MALADFLDGQNFADGFMDCKRRFQATALRA